MAPIVSIIDYVDCVKLSLGDLTNFSPGVGDGVLAAFASLQSLEANKIAMLAIGFVYLLASLGAGACVDQTTALNKAIDFVKDQKNVYTRDLLQLASFPSVSAKPDHIIYIEQAGKWLEKRLLRAGFEVRSLSCTRYLFILQQVCLLLLATEHCMVDEPVTDEPV